jgi:predicted lipoprotein with Yx(FWY)xxD motif
VTRTRTIRALALLAIASVVVLAGCGSSDDGSGGAYGGKGDNATSGETNSNASSANSSGGAFVSLASAPKLGLILVDSEGFTLYDFHKDKGGKSACYGGCAKVWPPLLTEGEPQSSNGVSASKLGTTKRDDGTVQVTYAGHPLYTYTTDTKPGEANGQDIDSFGAEWYALQGSGEEAVD